MRLTSRRGRTAAGSGSKCGLRGVTSETRVLRCRTWLVSRVRPTSSQGRGALTERAYQLQGRCLHAICRKEAPHSAFCSTLLPPPSTHLLEAAVADFEQLEDPLADHADHGALPDAEGGLERGVEGQGKVRQARCEECWHVSNQHMEEAPGQVACNWQAADVGVKASTMGRWRNSVPHTSEEKCLPPLKIDGSPTQVRVCGCPLWKSMGPPHK